MSNQIATKTTNLDERELITIQEFATRISIGVTKAREMSKSKILCDAGVSININIDGKGGTRIYWQKYLDFISSTPAVPESSRMPKRKIIQKSPLQN